MSSTMGTTMDMTPTSSAMNMATSAAAGTGSMMDMGMGMGNSCKISMLWNWYTVGACFISDSWQIKNKGMFAASCIGVVLLVVSLELLRRMSKEYDDFLLRRFRQTVAAQLAQIDSTENLTAAATRNRTAKFRASPLQQLIRAVLHAVTFGVAYIIMLLAMYYNGYIIISIFIGAGLGKFVCDWMIIELPLGSPSAETKTENTCDNPTVCCG